MLTVPSPLTLEALTPIQLRLDPTENRQSGRSALALTLNVSPAAGDVLDDGFTDVSDDGHGST